MGRPEGVVSLLICPRCGHDNPADRIRCDKCAARLTPTPVLVCPRCGHENPATRLSCDKCGTLLSPTPASEAARLWRATPARTLRTSPGPARAQAQAASREGDLTQWHVEYAGFWQRFWARLLDSLIVGVVGAIVAVGVGAVLATNTNDEPHPLALVYAYASVAVLFVSIFGYFWICTALGATFGMDALGIYIVREKDGESPGWGIGLGRIFMEYFLIALLAWTIVGCLPMYLWMIWDRKHQTWYDKAVGTIVVRRE